MTDKIHPSWNEHPNLLSELNPDGNKGFTHLGKPVSVLELAAGTSKKLDWKCRTCEHEWKSTGDSRKFGTGCPACSNKAIHSDGRNSMAITNPELALEYQGDATKSFAGTNKKLDWKCSTCEHEWKSTGSNRLRGRGCPACVGFLHSDGRNSMAMTHPDLAIEYQGDATKIIATSEKKLDWKCSTCEHEWKANGRNRSILGAGCPPCSTKKATEKFKITNLEKKGSMADTHQKIAAEYQGDATKIVAGVNIKLDWKCSTCEHEWKATGASRCYTGTGCPACSNKAIHSDGRNVMAITHPKLASEYQGDATKIVAGTGKMLDWKCNSCGHEWKATGDSRRSGNGCFPCGNKQATQTLLKNNLDRIGSMAETHPELALEYQGDATKIIAGTNNKLRWKCLVMSDEPCGHEWIATGNHRSGTALRGCPCCATTGFKPNEPAHYYVHKVTSELGNILYYKGGISGKWQRRLSELRNGLPVHLTIENCEVIPFEVGQDALNLETTLLRMAAEEGWKAPAQPFVGGHELFTQNPLEIAREKQLVK